MVYFYAKYIICFLNYYTLIPILKIHLLAYCTLHSKFKIDNQVVKTWKSEQKSSNVGLDWNTWSYETSMLSQKQNQQNNLWLCELRHSKVAKHEQPSRAEPSWKRTFHEFTRLKLCKRNMRTMNTCAPTRRRFIIYKDAFFYRTNLPLSLLSASGSISFFLHFPFHFIYWIFRSNKFFFFFSMFFPHLYLFLL